MQEVPAVTRSCEILELIAREETLGLSEISRRLEIPRSTAHGLLTTLERQGYLHRQPNGHFRLGMAIVNLARRVIVDVDIRATARPVMVQLAAKVGATVHLGVLDLEDFAVVYIEKVESPMPITLASWVGKKNPAYCTGVGKSLLAWSPDADRQRFLDRGGWQPLTPNTLVTRPAWEAELHQIRTRGHALDREEHHLGVRCISAPVFDHQRRLIAALSIAGPSDQVSETRLPELILAVRASADVITRLLGGAVATAL